LLCDKLEEKRKEQKRLQQIAYSRWNHIFFIPFETNCNEFWF
jgi:hypothetical protein